jgi:hypothetical protein
LPRLLALDSQWRSEKQAASEGGEEGDSWCHGLSVRVDIIQSTLCLPKGAITCGG